MLYICRSTYIYIYIYIYILILFHPQSRESQGPEAMKQKAQTTILPNNHNGLGLICIK